MPAAIHQTLIYTFRGVSGCSFGELTSTTGCTIVLARTLVWSGGRASFAERSAKPSVPKTKAKNCRTCVTKSRRGSVHSSLYGSQKSERHPYEYAARTSSFQSGRGTPAASIPPQPVRASRHHLERCKSVSCRRGAEPRVGERWVRLSGTTFGERHKSFLTAPFFAHISAAAVGCRVCIDPCNSALRGLRARRERGRKGG